MAHQRKLKKELAQSESTLKKLGNFAALVHQMIVQSLVTVILEDAISFLDLLKVENELLLTVCGWKKILILAVQVFIFLFHPVFLLFTVLKQ